jgi:hypothetical protein
MGICMVCLLILPDQIVKLRFDLVCSLYKFCRDRTRFICEAVCRGQ